MRWFWQKRKKLERPCQCGHLRCYHSEGRMGCHFGILGKTFDGRDCWGECQCAHFIETDKPEAEEEVKALEELMRK